MPRDLRRPERASARRARGAALLAALAVTSLAAHAGQPAEAEASARAGTALTAYEARYQVSYRGLSGGQIESSLRPAGTAGLWRYETRAHPNLLGRVAVSPQAHERSSMQLTQDGQVRPLEYDFDDGSAEGAKDVRLTFDWATRRVRGEAAGRPVDMDVPVDTQDTASVQAAMLVELLAGRTPTGFPIVTGDKLRVYRYWSEGRATIVTPLGQFETVVWANQRDGSSRVTRVWHAPALGYVPVQAIQYRKGRAETQMRLVTLER